MSELVFISRCQDFLKLMHADQIFFLVFFCFKDVEFFIFHSKISKLKRKTYTTLFVCSAAITGHGNNAASAIASGPALLLNCWLLFKGEAEGSYDRIMLSLN